MSGERDNDRDNKLEDALAWLAAGIPLEEILAGTGDDVEWLRPLLETAVDVGGLRHEIAVPSPEASLQRLLAYGEELAATSPSTRSVRPDWWLALSGLLRGGWAPRLATRLATAFLAVVFLGGVLSVAAQGSLPGQPLYGLKRGGETLRLSLTQNPMQRARLQETFNQRRQLEVQRLLEQGRPAMVSFEGQIEDLTATTIAVDGLVAYITSGTGIEGELAVKARIRLEGMIEPPDGLIALSITVLEPAPPNALPSPTSTPTSTTTARPTSIPTSTPTPTPTPTSTPSPTATIASSPTFTPTPQPTATLLPPTATNMPTLEPTPSPTATVAQPIPAPTGDSDGGDDSSNDNEGVGGGEGNDGDQSNGGGDSGDGDGGNDNENSGSGGDDDHGNDNESSGSSGGAGNDNDGGNGGEDDHGNDNDKDKS